MVDKIVALDAVDQFCHGMKARFTHEAVIKRVIRGEEKALRSEPGLEALRLIPGVSWKQSNIGRYRRGVRAVSCTIRLHMGYRALVCIFRAWPENRL